MKAPTPVLICATIVACVLMVCLTVLSVTGSDIGEFRATVSALFQMASGATSVGALLYAGSAARSAGEVRDRMPDQDGPPAP